MEADRLGRKAAKGLDPRPEPAKGAEFGEGQVFIGVGCEKKGDFIAVTFDPQSGHEQRRRRPALVVSNTQFNKHTGLAIV